MLLIASSSFVVWIGYRSPRLSLLNALYFSVETVSTVGYGDYSFVHQPWWLKVWALLLMLSGISIFAILMAYVADFLISRRLDHTLGRRRARRMREHVIVVGLGAFGLQVAARLREAGKQVLVIERDERNRFLGEAASLDLPVIFGDATSASVLESAQLRRAAAIAILTSDDMVNIETGIAVRDLLDDRWAAGRSPSSCGCSTSRCRGRSPRGSASRTSSRSRRSPLRGSSRRPWASRCSAPSRSRGRPSPSAASTSPPAALSTAWRCRACRPTPGSSLCTGTRRACSSTRRAGAPGSAAGDAAYIIGPNDELIGVLRRANTRRPSTGSTSESPSTESPATRP